MKQALHASADTVADTFGIVNGDSRRINPRPSANTSSGTFGSNTDRSWWISTSHSGKLTLTNWSNKWARSLKTARPLWANLYNNNYNISEDQFLLERLAFVVLS